MIGEMSYSDDSLYATVSGMTKEDFREYADACADNGFTVEVISEDKYYVADNADGYSLSIEYIGNNTIIVSLDAPDDAPVIDVHSSEAVSDDPGMDSDKENKEDKNSGKDDAKTSERKDDKSSLPKA